MLRRTDGVPLFVEEVSKALAERGRTNDVALADSDVPASLHDALMARLDRIISAKDVAQLAACIGREVDFRLLAAVADRPETELRQNLDELCDAELLFRRGTGPDATYVFKHALLRDAAYESLLKSRRRVTHARLLEIIERSSPTPVPEQAAYHAAGAELWAKAMRYYGAAGKAAIDRASNAEGIALIAKALDAGAHLESDPTTEAAMIDLRRARGWAYLTAGETERMLEELDDAERRADGFGMVRLTCQLRTQRTHIESIFGEADRAIMHGRDAVRIASTLDDPELLSAARFVFGHSFWIAGDYRAGVAELSVDADNYRAGLRVAGVGSSGILAVDGLAVLGDCLGQLGRKEEAFARGAEARAIAAEVGSTWDMNVANYHHVRALLANGDAVAALPLIEWNIEFGERRGLRMTLPWQLCALGNASLLLDRPDEAIDTLERAILSSRELGLQYCCGHALVLKAEACLAAGRSEAARAADAALDHARSHGYRAFEATALRLLAAATPNGTTPVVIWPKLGRSPRSWVSIWSFARSRRHRSLLIRRAEARPASPDRAGKTLRVEKTDAPLCDRDEALLLPFAQVAVDVFAAAPDEGRQGALCVCDARRTTARRRLGSSDERLGEPLREIEEGEVSHSLVRTAEARTNELRASLGQGPVVLEQSHECAPLEDKKRAVGARSRVRRALASIQESDLAEDRAGLQFSETTARPSADG